MLFGSHAIERSEARGAQEMASQVSQLPDSGLDNPVFAAMGVVVGEPVDGDPLFRRVTLPNGWKIERTDHNMWTRLVDAEGKTRADIFYKAAFYDRSAHIMPADAS